MRKVLTYVGVYAIAGFIGTLVYLLVKLVGNPKSLEDENVLSLPIYITLFYLLFSLPLVFLFDLLGWFHRFGFVKRIIAYHLIVWGGLSLVGILLEGRKSEAFLISILFFFIYVLPIALGAIIMNWLIHDTQGTSQFEREMVVKVSPPKTLRFCRLWQMGGGRTRLCY